MEELRRLSKKGTRLWVIKELKSEYADVKIKPAYTMTELINLFEEKHERKEIMQALMTTTNGHLLAACKLEDHLTAAIAVRFLYESIMKIV